MIDKIYTLTREELNELLDDLGVKRIEAHSTNKFTIGFIEMLHMQFPEVLKKWQKKINMNNNFKFCGYQWECAMEGGRIIHPDHPHVFYDDSQLWYQGITANAMLTLKKYTEPVEVKYWDGKTYHPQYGGGLLRSIDTFGYGTFSADIQLPQGKGLFPSFWLCGEGSWPEHGEIDVMEGYTDHNCLRIFTPYFPWINPSWTTTTNVHYSEDNTHKELHPRSVSVFKQPLNPSNHYIHYECKWTPDEIVIKVNGKVVRRDTKVVRQFLYGEDGKKMRVIFNLLCDDPAKHEVCMDKPMLISNFKYQPL